MKRTRDDEQAPQQRADWEWRERHSHQAHAAPRVVAVPAEDAQLWEETRRSRAARRAQQRRQRLCIGWKNAAVVVSASMVSLVLWVCTAHAYVTYDSWNEIARTKQSKMDDLIIQRDAARTRVALLSSNKGRAQLLVERGYLRAGERILLFPARSGEEVRQRAARIPVNDLAPPSPPRVEPTRWQKLARAVSQWRH